MQPVTRAPVLAALLAALLVAGCASIDVDAQQWSDIQPAGYAGFAWGEVRSADRDAPVSETWAAVEQVLLQRGMQRVAHADADLHVDLAFDVTSRVRTRDPHFNNYGVERYELGTLTIELHDARSGELLWSGTGESELRISAVPESPFTSTLVERDTPRDWKVARKVPEILEQLPAAFAFSGG